MGPLQPTEGQTPSEAELFALALEWSPEERAERLVQACGGDRALEQRILHLLNADSRVESVWPAMASLPYASDGVPRQIGRYRILRVLGRGGMGVVYEAEQDHPRRSIALKLLQASHLQERILRRFETEAQVLGLLSHPGIAQVFEASVIELEGNLRPYFAMELIEGQPLDSYAHGRSLEERIELLAQVCDAVHHAHQKGVVHRDLKPGNVLVTVDGRPKVVDFGVAHVEEGLLDGSLLQTREGEILGTLAYMSPEQVAGDSGGVDARTDVYSLGVMAYRLFGQRDPLQLEGLSVIEISRRIQHQEPPKLSRVNPELAGDLETIVHKAIDKEPGRRYAHAGELAADLRRQLADEPILARPASTVYSLKKFVKRNRVLVGGLTATFLALSIGLVASTWLYIDAKASWAAERVALEEAKESTRRAREDQHVADQTARFVTGMFHQANPFENPNALIDSRTFLLEGAKELDTDQGMSLRVKAKLGQTLTDLFEVMGHYEEGREWGYKTLDWIAELPTEESDALAIELSVRRNLSTLENYLGHHEAAIEQTRASLQRIDALGLPQTSEYAAEAVKLAAHYARVGKLDLARQALQDAELRANQVEDLNPAYHWRRIQAESGLAYAEGRVVDQLRLCRELLSRIEGSSSESIALKLTASKDYLRALEEAGQYEEALPFAQALLEEFELVLDANHPRLLDLRHTYSLLLQTLGDYASAGEQNLLILDALRDVYGEASNPYIANLSNLAGVYTKSGQLGKGEETYLRAMELAQQGDLLSPNAKAHTELDYAYLLMTHLGRTAEAQPILERALADLEAAGIQSGGTYRFGQKAYGMCLNKLGEVDGARTVYQALLAEQRASMGALHPDTAETLHNLALLERSVRNPEAAFAWHAECLEVLKAAYPEGHPLFGYCYAGIADMHLEMEQHPEAEAMFRKALEVREQSLPEGHYMTEVTRLGLASAVHAQGRHREARPLIARAEPILRAALPEGHFVLQSLDRIQSHLEGKTGDPAE